MLREKTPELKEADIPVWWVSHGTKMRLVPDENLKNWVVIRGSAAEVRIMKAPGKGWFVEYRIDHGGFGQTNGRVWMTDSEIGAAFGLKDEIEHPSNYIIERFGGTVAMQRKFIRWKEFLNIPGPGTGYQGDPNVSIKLYPETIEAVRNLLSQFTS